MDMVNTISDAYPIRLHPFVSMSHVDTKSFFLLY